MKKSSFFFFENHAKMSLVMFFFVSFVRVGYADRCNRRIASDFFFSLISLLSLSIKISGISDENRSKSRDDKN